MARMIRIFAQFLLILMVAKWTRYLKFEHVNSNTFYLNDQNKKDFSDLDFIGNETIFNSLLSINSVVPSKSNDEIGHVVKKTLCKSEVNGDKYICTVLLLVSGDIQINPGPVSCNVCDKKLRKNSKTIQCMICYEKTHVKCALILKSSKIAAASHICTKCGFQNMADYVDDGEDQNDVDYEDDNNRIKFFEKNFECFKAKGLHFVHINARSIVNKVEEIKFLARSSNASVLAVSETWLDDSILDSEIKIPGYKVIRHDRNREGGGVCLYIRENLAFNERPDLKHKKLETIFADILLPKTKPILIGCVYRPPKFSQFYNNLEESLMSSSSLDSQESYILGDFNTNYVAENKSSLMKSLKMFMKNFSLLQLIDTPTRVTVKTKTILDLILVTDSYKVSQSGTLPYGMSDHNIVYVTRKIKKGQINRHNTVNIRSMKNYSKDKFIEKLNEINWFYVLNELDVNSAWKNFREVFSKKIDEIAPMKEVRLRSNSEPWFDGNILNLISERDKLVDKIRKGGATEDVQKRYRKLRNKVQCEIKKAKQNYILNQIEEQKNDSKKLWKTLKGLGLPDKKSEKAKITLKIDEEIVFDDKRLANRFNNFFCTIANSLVDKLPKVDRSSLSKKINDFYKSKDVEKNSFCLCRVNEDLVVKHLSSLNVSKATGQDGISARFIKDASGVIAKPITHIINLSLVKGEVPNDFKIAKVNPLFKKGDRNCESNYRPVSVLPVISKTIERIVFDQLHSYLDKNNLIYKFQSGFRKSYSTESALAFLSDSIKFNMDNGLYTGMVLIDLQKAFDTVDHEILIQKLSAIGANENAISWFKSYLSERKQFVIINREQSDMKSIECGVPQGSILGPLLFLVYVNDMTSAVDCSLFLYADDSALVVAGKSVDDIIFHLSKNLNSLSDWLIENKLSLHLGKTESILFALKRKLKKCKSSFDIVCKDNKIVNKSEVKYLGSILSNDLNGSKMAESNVKKINNVVKFLYRKANFLPKNNRKLLCNSLAQPHFDYACLSWYRSSSVKLQVKLQCAQNKLIRFINSYNSRKHLSFDDFKNLKWLNVSFRVEFVSLCNMFKINQNCAPMYLCDLKLINPDVHTHKTRYSFKSYVVPKVKSNGKTTFKYNAIKSWNSLPKYIKISKSLDKFKSLAKKHLMHEMSKTF